jgi:ribonucleotide monophosphatase NagD (HAD superfamily)
MDLQEGAEVYCFDIDGTLCTEKKGDCLNAEPIPSRIAVVNRLYTQGAKIYLMTARGMLSADNDQQLADKNMRKMTEKQLKEWGVLYHQLFFGKPRAMHYIDDKGWNDSDFFRQF